MITVIAANTNWKNISVAIGKASAGMPEAAAGMVAWPGGERRRQSPATACRGTENHCGPNAML